ncbi:MAG TPA: fibronectin type III domain-containing protein [Pyrinomonadaceae bacterium]|nr:fibronectin type III domain-containing protein [Pyrinomonadaceae bacterium]HMP64890.1 fibronectin type III domain-containing protein [Pyrinomonadaceae bacterium]
MRNKNRFKQLIKKAPIALVAVGLLMGLSCGKRGAPRPPRERVVQRAELTGFQRGGEVILSWKMPAQNAPPDSVLNIDRVDVYRLAEPLTAPQAMTEEEFASRGIVIAAIKTEESDFGLKPLTFRDRLQFAGQAVRLRYAVRYVNAAGQRAAFSNFFLIEVAASVANAPTSLSHEVSQEAVALFWTEPTENVDGTKPVNLLGYNVYRSSSATEAGRMLNREPVQRAEYRDETFEFENEYFYFVRAVSLGPDGEQVESSESNIIEVSPVDTFPPSAPVAITIAASPNTVSIFFPANPEPDVAGYSIYRSTDPDLPLEDWELLTPELSTVTTFQDNNVESGKTYYYYVTATDIFKNVSPPSEVVNETVP